MEHKHLDTKKSRGFFLAALTALVAIFTLSSCLKNRNNDDEAPASFITFVHSLPQSQYSTLDFYVGGVKSTAALQFTQNSGQHLSSPPYIGYYAGTYPFQVALGGTLQQILGLTGTLEPYTNYSFFLATSSAAADTVVAVVLKDNLTAPSAGKAKIRFVNLVRNTSSYDLSVQGNAAVLFSNKAYKASGDFIEVPQGDYVYELKDAGTATTRASTSLKVDANKIYTIWASGGASSATTTTDPKLNIIVNK